MHRCGIDILREVLFAGVCSLASHSATALLAELRQCGALDISQMAYGYDHRVVGVEVFGVELFARILYLRAAHIAVLLLDLLQLFLHHLLAQLRVVEYCLQVGYQLLQFLKLLVQLVHLQTGQLAQTHVYDGASLNLVEVETLHEVVHGLLRSLRRADDVYHLVNIVASHDESFEYVCAVLRLFQVEFRASYGHIVTVFNKVAHAVFEREQAWASLHQCDAVHRERALQSRHLEQLVENHVGVGLALHVHHDAHALSSRLVVDVADALNLLFRGEVGYVFHKIGLVHAVGNLRYDNLVVSVAALNFGLGAHHNAAATCLVGVAHSLYTIYICTCWEVGSLDVLHQSVGVYVGIVYIGAAAVNHLAEVVRRYVCSHTHGNTVASVHQQIRYLGGHHRRLLKRVVEVVHHVHGVLLEVVHDVLAHFRQAALRVTHGGRRVTVHRTEVSLAVNERVAHVPVLRHAHQSSIHGTVTVGVVLTEHLSNHAGALLIRFVTCVSDTHHTVQYTAVHRFESVTHIG